MTEKTSPGPLRLMLVDDHPVVRQGLRAVFGSFDDIEVVAEASDGAQALHLLRVTEVDCVLMDLQMPGVDGVTATRQITALPDGPAVLVLTTYDSDADIIAAVDAGASGYLLKDAAPELIMDAARRAARGESALAPEVADRLKHRTRSSQTLTRREVEILELLAGGATNRAMAKELFISEATVKTHLVHIFDKLGVDNRTTAVATARERRLIR
ncbi:response regulator [Propionibacteriaceae bacterium Y1685]